jgi:hypothetical protein
MLPFFAISKASVGPVLQTLISLAAGGPLRPLALNLLLTLWEKHPRIYPELLQAVLTVPRFPKLQDGVNDQVALLLCFGNRICLSLL